MELLGITKKFKGKFLDYYNATYRNKLGEDKVYELISRNKNLTVDSLGNLMKKKSDAVGIIVFDAENTSRILLLKEYRLACGEWVYNFPGGLIDEGETPVMAATRELREETGLELTEVIKVLPNSYTSVGLSNESTCTVIRKASGNIKLSTSADEEIETAWYSKYEVRSLLKSQPMSLRTQSFLYLWSNTI